jgi:hypothetical protein
LCTSCSHATLNRHHHKKSIPLVSKGQDSLVPRRRDSKREDLVDAG